MFTKGNSWEITLKMDLTGHLVSVFHQVTEEMMEQANEKKIDAINALGEGEAMFCSVQTLSSSCRCFFVRKRQKTWSSVFMIFFCLCR